MCKCIVVDSETRGRAVTAGFIEKFRNLTFVKSFTSLQEAAEIIYEHHIDFLFLHVPTVSTITDNAAILAELKAIGTRIVVISDKYTIFRNTAALASDFVMKPVTSVQIHKAFTRG